jgi:hypothetical protein
MATVPDGRKISRTYYTRKYYPLVALVGTELPVPSWATPSIKSERPPELTFDPQNQRAYPKRSKVSKRQN